ncbi:hypothetical protein FYK55_12130 [Roseiconus nitratireducens]|uniref:Secreted protein n=1 Tax=Roseiconus nitratireducens TaxID=2605748 RepID=A0A5M6D682_9BACT|nr:hypothetical protein [Roseiconus nitratireducens]KAA5543037.1 hypothetical protein FYK55_12130 [Roseiconus nitratireducens]
MPLLFKCFCLTTCVLLLCLVGCQPEPPQPVVTENQIDAVRAYEAAIAAEEQANRGDMIDSLEESEPQEIKTQ